MPFVSAATRHTREVSDSGAKLTGSNHQQQQQQQQQQQRFERRQLSPSKRPQSPSILAAAQHLPPVSAAAAAASAAHAPHKASSSTHSSSNHSNFIHSSITHSISPAGPVPGPQLVQHLQLPSSVKAMLALPHSMSQQRFRERQRLELYALNAIMGM
jgi:hypothetical protein